MIGLTRKEKENLVLDLYYNQGKTYSEISKEARISLRDIGPILKKSGIRPILVRFLLGLPTIFREQVSATRGY